MARLRHTSLPISLVLVLVVFVRPTCLGTTLAFDFHRAGPGRTARVPVAVAEPQEPRQPPSSYG